ncbi:MAG: hypothetical protein IJ192_02445 [Clostridia bacterium]|nr:hypothetical protein [Clostridia bacterium]
MITEEMIHSAKNGDETAFETIFEESKEDILTVINCEFSFRNQQDTDDILQNIHVYRYSQESSGFSCLGKNCHKKRMYIIL